MKKLRTKTKNDVLTLRILDRGEIRLKEKIALLPSTERLFPDFNTAFKYIIESSWFYKKIGYEALGKAYERLGLKMLSL